MTDYYIATVSQGLHFLGELDGIVDHGEAMILNNVWELVLVKQQVTGPNGAVTGMSSIATLLPIGISTGPLKTMWVKPMAFIECSECGLNERAQELVDSVSDGAQRQRAKDAGIQLAPSLVDVKHRFPPKE